MGISLYLELQRQQASGIRMRGAILGLFVVGLATTILASLPDDIDCSAVPGITEAEMPSVVTTFMAGPNGWDANGDGMVKKEDADAIGGPYPALFEEIKDLYSKGDELITDDDMAIFLGCEEGIIVDIFYL